MTIKPNPCPAFVIVKINVGRVAAECNRDFDYAVGFCRRYWWARLESPYIPSRIARERPIKTVCRSLLWPQRRDPFQGKGANSQIERDGPDLVGS